MKQHLKSVAGTPGHGEVPASGQIDPLLTPEQLMTLLGVSIQKIDAMRSEGTGPKYLKLGHRTTRYRLSDVNAWLAAHETTCTSERRS